MNHKGTDNIGEDIENGNTYVLLENDKIVGTGTRKENHITRVYVLCKCKVLNGRS